MQRLNDCFCNLFIKFLKNLKFKNNLNWIFSMKLHSKNIKSVETKYSVLLNKFK